MAGLLGYGAFLASHASRAAAAADSSGYLNHARALVAGEIARPIRVVAALGLADVPAHVVLPLGFAAGRTPGTMVPSYPPGLPLHIAGAAAVLGWERGPFAVAPLFAALGLAAFWWLARELGLRPSEALAGILVLALHPVYVLFGLVPMSDVPATAWATLAVAAALRTRRSSAWALLAGAAFAASCLVRPSNALLLLPLAFALPPGLAVWTRFALGAIPGFAFLGWFNAQAYGHPLRTGYGELTEGFAFASVRQRFDHYTHWLGKTFTPLVPLAWLGVAASRDRGWRDRLLLVSWFSAFFAFYCVYRHHDAWWYLRFLLPAFPALVIGAILALRPLWGCLELRLRVPRLGRISGNLLPLVALAAVLGREASVGRRQAVLAIGQDEAVYPNASRYVSEHLPPRSVVLSFLMSGALEYYTDLPQLRFDLLERRLARQILRRAQERGYRFYALVHPAEREVFFGRNLGSWREVATPADALLLELDAASLRPSAASASGDDPLSAP